MTVCSKCGRAVASTLAIEHCPKCGGVLGEPGGRPISLARTEPSIGRQHYDRHLPTCKSCPHWGTNPRGKEGCLLHPICPERIRSHLLNRGGCFANPPLFPPLPDVTWAVGVTTAPRHRPTLDRSLASIRAAGWDGIRVFADGDVDVPEGYDVTRRLPASGAFSNWWLALQELVQRKPEANRYALFQDDVVLCRGVREFVERLDHHGILSLYQAYQHQNRETVRYAQSGKHTGFTGALALVIPRDVAHRLAASPMGINHRKGMAKKGRHNALIDGAIGKWCEANDVPLWICGPSLVQHTGGTSTIGHREKPSPTFVGEDFDARTLPKLRLGAKRIALVVPDKAAWLGPSRAQIFHRVFKDAGYRVEVIPVGPSRMLPIDSLAGFDLVCNHAMQLSSALIDEAATRLPGTTFVSINHSAIAHLERTGESYVTAFAESLRLARKHLNVWYASQEPVADQLRLLTGIERCMWLPAPGPISPPRQVRPPNDPANIVMAGRADSIKNNLVQAVACSMARRAVRLILCVNRTPGIAAALSQLGVDHQWRGQLPHPGWIEFLRSEADVVLCCSLAESFGFVAAEAMQRGVPVVASDAIRFADPALRAKHTDPRDIAAKIDEALGDYEARSREAAKLGAAVMAEQEREYLARTEMLLK